MTEKDVTSIRVTPDTLKKFNKRKQVREDGSRETAEELIQRLLKRSVSDRSFSEG